MRMPHHEIPPLHQSVLESESHQILWKYGLSNWKALGSRTKKQTSWTCSGNGGAVAATTASDATAATVADAAAATVSDPLICWWHCSLIGFASIANGRLAEQKRECTTPRPYRPYALHGTLYTENSQCNAKAWNEKRCLMNKVMTAFGDKSWILELKCRLMCFHNIQ